MSCIWRHSRKGGYQLTLFAKEKPCNKLIHLSSSYTDVSACLWLSTHTELCQSEHSIALMNQWILFFIHSCLCQLFSGRLSPVFALSPRVILSIWICQWFCAVCRGKNIHYQAFVSPLYFNACNCGIWQMHETNSICISGPWISLVHAA